MDEHAADLLLKFAKKHLYGNQKRAADPLHAYRILDTIVEMSPGTGAAQEATLILRSAGQLPSEEAPSDGG